MGIAVRPLRNNTEYRAVEQLQREVWGLDDVEVVAHDLLVTAHKNGGLVLGAFVPGDTTGDERLIGFVFSFVGLHFDGRLKHCSHLAGVAPAYQGRDIGYQLKLAQRAGALNQGINLITWTFEPLESRNAYFNLHKLGATCRTYLCDVYGQMRDNLNAGLPSDRFQVDWEIQSERVITRLQGEQPPLSPARLLTEGAPLVNRSLPGDWPQPADLVLPLVDRRVLVEIPARFQALKAADLGLAQAWREHSRLVFESAFAAGYIAADLLFEAGQSYYLLEKDKNLDENRTN